MNIEIVPMDGKLRVMINDELQEPEFIDIDDLTENIGKLILDCWFD